MPSGEASAEEITLDTGLRRGQRPLKVAEQVARTLVTHIADLDLQPNHSLPNERAMTEMLGVGRATLREALRLLETQGVLVLRPGPGGGPVVRHPQADDLVNSTSLILQVMRVRFADIIGARIATEPEVARLAATQRSAAQLVELRERHEAVRAEPPTLTGYVADYRARLLHFHELIGQCCENPVLVVLSTTLRQISDTFEQQIAFHHDDWRLSLHNHTKLLEAIEAKDGERAHHYSREHMLAYEGFFKRHHPGLLNELVRWMPSN